MSSFNFNANIILIFLSLNIRIWKVHFKYELAHEQVHKVVNFIFTGFLSSR